MRKQRQNKNPSSTKKGPGRFHWNPKEEEAKYLRVGLEIKTRKVKNSVKKSGTDSSIKGV